MKLWTRTLALGLVLAVAMVSVPISITAGGPQLLTLNDAMNKGVAFSSEIRSANKKIYEKKVALKQAQKSVRYAKQKLRRLFEKKPIYDQSFGIETKVQKAQVALVIANKERETAEIKARYAVKNAYLGAYNGKVVLQIRYKRLNEESEKLKLAKIKVSQGLIDQDTYKEQEEIVTKKQQEFDKAEAGYETAKSKLSELIDIDVSNRDFSYTWAKAYLPESKLQGILTNVFDQSGDLYALNENIKLNTSIVNVNGRLYRNEFSSSRLKAMDRLVDKGIGNIEDLELIQSYDNLVDSLISKWGEDWKSYYEISLLVISIKIPKLFRTGEYDGVRYLEDSRYALMLSIVQTQQLLEQEKQTRKALAQQAVNLFGSINDKSVEYNTLVDEFKTLENDYNINQKKLKLNLVEPDVLIEQKNTLDEMEEQMGDLLYGINQKVVELDEMTNGRYSVLLGQEQLLNPNLKPSPFKRPLVNTLIAAIEKEEQAGAPLSGSWSLAQVAEGLTAKFSIELTGTEAATITEYQVYTTDGVVVSQKLSVKEPFIHLDAVLSNTSSLTLYFYNVDNQLMYKGTLDGYGEKGRIVTQAAQ